VNMQITCLSCQKSFLIDETRYPVMPKAFKCPGCGSQIPTGGQDAAPKEKPQPQAKEEDASSIKDQILRELLSYLPINKKNQKEEEEDEDLKPKALVCDDEQMFQELLRSALVKMGYSVDIAESTTKSIDLIRKNDYAVVTVDNRFPDDPEGGFKILGAANGLPPEKRRKLFIAFISADLATMDTNSAFVYGANLTVAKKDTKKMEQILRQGLQDHDRQYRTFFEVWEEVKRAEITKM